MSKKYTEIVLEGNFMLAKGFLLGFLSNAKPDSKYFFHRKSGIRRETFKELLKEFFELDNYAHVCIESDLVEPFKKALRLYTDITGNVIKSEKEIASASFTCSYELFNKELADKAKAIFENLPDDVTLDHYAPVEINDGEGHGVESYAPLHEYIIRATGTLSGNFESVMDIYLKIKKGDLSESIICSEVTLEFK